MVEFLMTHKTTFYTSWNRRFQRHFWLLWSFPLEWVRCGQITRRRTFLSRYQKWSDRWTCPVSGCRLLSRVINSRAVIFIFSEGSREISRFVILCQVNLLDLVIVQAGLTESQRRLVFVSNETLNIEGTLLRFDLPLNHTYHLFFKRRLVMFVVSHQFVLVFSSLTLWKIYIFFFIWTWTRTGINCYNCQYVGSSCFFYCSSN